MFMFILDIPAFFRYSRVVCFFYYDDYDFCLHISKKHVCCFRRVKVRHTSMMENIFVQNKRFILISTAIAASW